jgi:hypothetical protein
VHSIVTFFYIGSPPNMQSYKEFCSQEQFNRPNFVTARRFLDASEEEEEFLEQRHRELGIGKRGGGGGDGPVCRRGNSGLRARE